MLPAPVQPVSCSNLPHVLQIALVTSHDADRQDLVLFHPVFSFDIDHLGEEVERLEGAGLSDVIDQQECVAFQIRLRPKAAVFFLPGGVCEAEGVCRAINGSCNGVGVFNRGIVSAEIR